MCKALTSQRCWTNGSCKTSACVSAHIYLVATEYYTRRIMAGKERIPLWCEQYVSQELKANFAYAKHCYAVLCYVIKGWILIIARLMLSPAFLREGNLDLSHWLRVSKRSWLHISKTITFNLIYMNWTCQQCRNTNKWGKSALKAQQDLPMSAQNI